MESGSQKGDLMPHHLLLALCRSKEQAYLAFPTGKSLNFTTLAGQREVFLLPCQQASQ